MDAGAKVLCHQNFSSLSYDPFNPSVEINAVVMKQPGSDANANLSLAAAVKRFETLTSADQLSILALVFRYDVGRIGVTETSERAGHEHAAAAIECEPLSHNSASKVVVSQGLEPEWCSGIDLRELAAAVNEHENYSSSRAKAGKSRSVRVANQAPMNFQHLSITVTMIVSFSLALGTMLWQRKTERLAAPESQIPVSSRTTPVVGPRNSPSLVPVHAGEQPVLPPPPLEAKKMAVPPPHPKETSESEGGGPAGAVPVAINIWNRKNRHRIEGYVTNTSVSPLSVTLEVIGQENSVLQLDLAPGAGREFSSDSGFAMQANDRVVVHSEPFQDLITQVP